MNLESLRWRLALWVDRRHLEISLSVWLAFIAFILLLGAIVHRADFGG